MLCNLIIFNRNKLHLRLTFDKRDKCRERGNLNPFKYQMQTTWTTTQNNGIGRGNLCGGGEEVGATEVVRNGGVFPRGGQY